MFIIDGKIIAEKVKDEIALETIEIAKSGFDRPSLAIILIGERDDSKLYVALKEKEALKLGIDTHLYKFDDDIKENDVIDTIEFLNNDVAVDAILIQLPLPEHLDTNKILNHLDPKKDADGFSIDKPDYVISPVLASVMRILFEISFVVTNKKACVLYNSEIFGLTIKKGLEQAGVSVSLISLKDFTNKNPEEKIELFKKTQKKCLSSNLIISAIGMPEFIDESFIADDAIVIDVGISSVDGKIVGDVNQKSLLARNIWLTPVPGGVGPMTIAMLFKNVLAIYNQKK